MTDRVYPSSKPIATSNGTAAPAANGGNPNFPASKAQLYNATRPTYRPQPGRHRRSQRSCCCSCCLWTTLVVIFILLLAAIAGAILWVLYRPHRPSFSVSTLQISQFNLTSSTQLTTKFNLTVIARNPNKNIVFFYNPTSISITSNGVDVGDGTLPAFEHGKRNTTVLRTTIATAGQTLDGSSAASLKSDLENGKALPLKIRLETKVKVKIGGLETKKVGVRVTCEGIKATAPTGKKATAATISDARCKVDLRIKIWKVTF
ncbi:hypothetical protein NMG60_11002455 [Bertholletia excelsa]